MTSIASAPLMPPLGEPKRDPAPARAGGSASASSFRAALATASTGGPADGRQRPAPQKADDKPTHEEAARPVLTLLALAKAASKGEEPPAAGPEKAGVSVAATEPTIGPGAPVDGKLEVGKLDIAKLEVAKPEVGASPVIAAGHPATVQVAPAAAPHVAASLVGMAPAPGLAKEPKLPGRTATGQPAAHPKADPSDTPSTPPSDAGAAPGVAIVITLIAGPGLVPATEQAPAGGGPSASGSATPAIPTIAPRGAAAGGASAGQGAAPALAAAAIPPSAAVQGLQPPAASGDAKAKPETLPAAENVASGGVPASPAAASLAAAPQPASVLPTQPPAAAAPAAPTLARADAAARIVPAAMPAAPTLKPPAGDAETLVKLETGSAASVLPAAAPVASTVIAIAPATIAAAPSVPAPHAPTGNGEALVKPEIGAGPSALPVTAPVARVAVAVAPVTTAQTPAALRQPVAVSATAERAASEPVTTSTETTASQNAVALSAPVPKGATASEPGKAAAPAPSAAAVDASGSQGASQDGAAGQGRGEGRPPSPVLRHEGVAAKPVVGPALAVSPTSVAAGAPDTATGQVLQLFSSLGLTGEAEGGTAADGSVPGTPGAAPAATRASSMPDTVTLQLAPEALGRITVTLRLRGQALDVRLVADKRATLESLGRDRHQLEAALGVTAEAIDIAFGPQAGSAGTEGGPQGSAPELNSATSDQGHGRSRGRSQDARSSGGDGDGTATPAPERPTERRDGSLYL